MSETLDKWKTSSAAKCKTIFLEIDIASDSAEFDIDIIDQLSIGAEEIFQLSEEQFVLSIPYIISIYLKYPDLPITNNIIEIVSNLIEESPRAEEFAQLPNKYKKFLKEVLFD